MTGGAGANDVCSVASMICVWVVPNPFPRSTHPPEHCPLSVRGWQTDMALSVPGSLWNTMNVKVKDLRDAHQRAQQKHEPLRELSCQ